MSEQKFLTPRQIKTQQAKDKILSAAVKLIDQYGFESLTIKNVCEEAGISNGSFFHHFKTKDELLSYYLAKGRRDFVEHTPTCATGDIKEIVIQIYISYVQYCEETGIGFISKYYATSNQALNTFNPPPGSKSRDITLHDDVVVAVEAAQKSGMVLAEQDARSIAHEICIIIKGILFDWCLSGGAAPLEKSVVRLLGIYLDSIVTDAYREQYETTADHTNPNG